MLNWFLIYTKPKCEDSVSFKLMEKGFAVLNPKIKERKYLRRKLQYVVSPLFPCYIFMQFDSPKDYRLIKYTRGVKTIVGTEDVPAVVPVEIIKSIQDRMEEGFVNITRRKFSAGEEVLIKAGPFEGFNAVFEKELRGTERVSILLKAVNARVVADGAILEKV